MQSPISYVCRFTFSEVAPVLAAGFTLSDIARAVRASEGFYVAKFANGKTLPVVFRAAIVEDDAETFDIIEFPAECPRGCIAGLAVELRVYDSQSNFEGSFDADEDDNYPATFLSGEEARALSMRTLAEQGYLPDLLAFVRAGFFRRPANITTD